MAVEEEVAARGGGGAGALGLGEDRGTVGGSVGDRGGPLGGIRARFRVFLVKGKRGTEEGERSRDLCVMGF